MGVWFSSRVFVWLFVMLPTNNKHLELQKELVSESKCTPKETGFWKAQQFGWWSIYDREIRYVLSFPKRSTWSIMKPIFIAADVKLLCWLHLSDAPITQCKIEESRIQDKLVHLTRAATTTRVIGLNFIHDMQMMLTNRPPWLTRLLWTLSKMQ